MKEFVNDGLVKVSDEQMTYDVQLGEEFTESLRNF